MFFIDVYMCQVYGKIVHVFARLFQHFFKLSLLRHFESLHLSSNQNDVVPINKVGGWYGM